MALNFLSPPFTSLHDLIILPTIYKSLCMCVCVCVHVLLSISLPFSLHFKYFDYNFHQTAILYYSFFIIGPSKWCDKIP